jgi:hypothetical protein
MRVRARRALVTIVRTPASGRLTPSPTVHFTKRFSQRDWLALRCKSQRNKRRRFLLVVSAGPFVRMAALVGKRLGKATSFDWPVTFAAGIGVGRSRLTD